MSAQNQIVGHEKLCSERYGRIDRTLSRVFGWVVVGAGTTMLTLMTALATVVWYQITHH